MLVLTQHLEREADDIFIGDDIIVRVVGVVSNGTAVKIGIEAPKHIPILRRSVRDRRGAGSDGNR